MTRQRRRVRGRIAGSLLAVFLFAAQFSALPAVSPAQAQLLGGSEEALGAEEHPKILAEFGGAYQNAALQAFIDRVGHRLAATTDRPGPWTFTVLDSEVINAFAVPGGYVYVTRGLIALAKDEAEIAGVLGHEIGHVVAHHTRARETRSAIAGLLAAGVGYLLNSPELAQLANAGGNAVIATYSRGQESEADRLGIGFLERAGYDPFAMATFLETMRRDAQYESLRAGQGANADRGYDFFATHPRTENREEEAAAAARKLPQGGMRPVEPYLAAIDGMTYGDSPDNGFVRGRTFAHPGLGIAFDVPPRFALLNGARQVIAKGPDGGGAIVFDGGPAKGLRDPATYLARVWAEGAPLQGLQNLTINGMPAATAVTQGKTDDGTVDVRLVAVRADADTVYRFTFLAPSGTLGRLDPLFQKTADSFRRLSRAEAAQYRPQRLRVVPVQPGTTVESLIRAMPQQPYAEELFRIINDLPPGTPLPPGRMVKIVTD